MIFRYTCRFCYREVSSEELELEFNELKESYITAGYFHECPFCGAENLVEVKEKEEMDNFNEVEDWEEEEVD